MERYKIQQLENRYRSDLEGIRADFSKNIEAAEEKHSLKRKSLEEEKAMVVADKNTGVEDAKKKLGQLNKLDMENKELQYSKNLDNQRQLF